MRRLVYLAILSQLLVATVGCGSDVRDRENYGDLGSMPGAIILDSPAKHWAGWGRKDCLLCHNAALNIHQRPGASIDVDKLNREIKNGGESRYCLTCHGSNGIQ